MFKRSLGPAVALFVAGLGCELGSSAPKFTHAQRLGGVEVSAEVLNQGALLYGRYCASCHGAQGDGRGAAARDLSAAPRDFQQARFRYASSSPEELPTHEGLIALISRGVPAQGMPGWKGMRHEDLSALAYFIKTFSPRWDERASAGADAGKPAEASAR